VTLLQPTLSPVRATDIAGPGLPARHQNPHKREEYITSQSVSEKYGDLFRGCSWTSKLSLFSKLYDICNSDEVVWKSIWIKLVA